MHVPSCADFLNLEDNRRQLAKTLEKAGNWAPPKVRGKVPSNGLGHFVADLHLVALSKDKAEVIWNR
jgi:hypothetical protein